MKQNKPLKISSLKVSVGGGGRHGGLLKVPSPPPLTTPTILHPPLAPAEPIPPEEGPIVPFEALDNLEGSLSR